MPPIRPPHEPVEVLDLAGLYLSTARRCADESAPGEAFHEVQQRLRERYARFQALEDAGEISAAHDLAITMDHDYEEVLDLQREPLRNCALANVLSALAVEAHVNRLIEEMVAGEATRQTLLWAPMKRKVQALLEQQGADPLPEDEPPYSDLKSLWSRRNALVHYEPEEVPFDGVEPPDLPPRLGMTPHLGKHAVDTARAVISELSSRLDRDPPRWLDDAPLDFFSLKLTD